MFAKREKPNRAQRNSETFFELQKYERLKETCGWEKEIYRKSSFALEKKEKYTMEVLSLSHFFSLITIFMAV